MLSKTYSAQDFGALWAGPLYRPIQKGGGRRPYLSKTAWGPIGAFAIPKIADLRSDNGGSNQSQLIPMRP